MQISARQRLALIASLGAWLATPVQAREAVMSDEAFWTIVDATVVRAENQDEQCAALAGALGALSPDDIVSFEAAFQRHMRRAYTWDLWGAGYVIHGGMSDDGFEYFRRWLISKGRVTYERALANPEDLSDMVAADAESALEFEMFAYVAGEVWLSKTGGALDAFYKQARSTFPGGEPQGQPFDEDEAHLAARYPKLWRRFGDTPLM